MLDFKAVDSIIAQIDINRKVDSLSTLDWLRNYGSVELSLPRQVGKTKYIKERAGKHDLIVSNLKKSAVESVFGDLRAKKVLLNGKTMEEIISDLGNQIFDNVWFDECAIDWIFIKDLLDNGNIDTETKIVSLRTDWKIS